MNDLPTKSESYMIEIQFHVIHGHITAQVV